MPTARSGAYDIVYEVAGAPGARPLLCIRGLGSQLVSWPDALLERLVDAGFFLVLPDNRDTGLSTKTPGDPPDVVALAAAVAAGEEIDPPYRLADMADDMVAVLDDAGVGSAHVMGISMGGMIAQELAIGHPERVRSLCSIMSTTGAPGVGQAAPEVLAAIMADLDPEPAGSVDELIERGLEGLELTAGTLFDADEARRRLRREIERCHHPIGQAFQVAAVLAGPDRTDALRRLDVPAVVVHGALDRLVDPSGGEATAAAIPGAELVVLDGMGHDLPGPRLDLIVDAIVAAASRAEQIDA